MNGKWRAQATKLLKLVLQEAKKKDINKVLVAAYTGNVGSWKVMEKCNGKLDRIVIEEETGLPIKQYWIQIEEEIE